MTWKWKCQELQYLNEEWEDKFTPERIAKAEQLSKMSMYDLVMADMRDDACRLRFGNKDWDSGPLYNTFLSARSRAQQFTNVLTLTIEEWRYILSIYDYHCLRCRTQKDITMDHIVPLSKGGTHSMDNIQPLCSSCNSAKGTKSTDYRTGIGKL